MTSPRAAAYVRVSTVRQDSENQVPSLLRLCEARGWSDPAVFSETESGAKTRPVLDEVCHRATRGEFRVIIVWALDRLGRNMHEVINRVRSLDAAGVRLVSFSEGWLDTSGPARDLLLAIFGWLAQWERNRLIERTRAGLARARARGRVLGRPRTADPDEVARLRGRGLSWRQIARQLECSTGAARRAAQSALVACAENPPSNGAPVSVGNEVAR
ncbi:MAG: recombinase family protein [Pseudomonadota bacterium]